MKNKICILFILVLFYFNSGNCTAQQQQKPEDQIGGGYLAEMIDYTKKTIVFLGKINLEGKPQYIATGFLVQVNNVYHLITAKHVVLNPFTGKYQDEDLLVFFNLKKGGVAARSIKDLKQRSGVYWVFHENEEVDVAIIPFSINSKTDDVRVVKDDQFLMPENIFELYDVFFMSFQPGLEGDKEINPIIRSGTISLINKNKSFIIDATAFPGNSGSPVFLKPSHIRYRKDGEGIIVFGKGDPIGGKFIGIIGDYVQFKDVAVSAQTGHPRIVFEENTGLSRVWSVNFIEEIFQSQAFNKQLAKIIGKK